MDAQHASLQLAQDHNVASSSSPRSNGYRVDIGASAIDPPIQEQRTTMNQASPRFKTPASVSPPLTRRDGPRSLQSSPRHPRSALAQAIAMRTSPSVSPRMSHLSPRSQRQSVDPHRADDRSLPSRDVTDETIDDAYIAFILYANPGVPSSTDTSELRKIFRAPPRSDGKNFSIFTLWELIRKLENKEVKTWTQLAIDLGVEPPSAEKNQSTQKVQQYAVRLKRWMHAMHVDAFFEFLLGKPHLYYTQLPTSAGQTPDSARDGVALEEDLALRALMPEWKPKRGRKKAEDKEGSVDRDIQSAKKQRLGTPQTALDYDSFPDHSVVFPPSAIPWSAYPTEHDPWTTGVPISGAPFGHVQGPPPHPFPSSRSALEARWQRPSREFSPAGAYPQSAITPRHRPADHIPEPQSAITPSTSGSKSKARRRHGPAVSSAWPSMGNPSTGKLRGRPPSNRSIQDGPFTTFPAKPKDSQPPATTDNGVDADSVPTPTIERDPHVHPGVAIPTTQAAAANSNRFQQLQRGSKLQLQVPQHSGPPIRMATPPTLLVNGQTDRDGIHIPPYAGRRTSADFFNDPDDHESNAGISQIGPASMIDFTADDVARVFATKVLQAKLVPQQESLTVADAKVVANQVVLQLAPALSANQTPLSLVKLAVWLGVGKDFGLGGDAPSTLTIKFQASAGNKSATPNPTRDRELSLSLSHGKSATLNLHVKSLTLPASANSRDLLDKEVVALRKELGKTNASSLEETFGPEGGNEMDDAASEETWKERYLKLRREHAKIECDIRRYKRKILEAVMAGDEIGKGKAQA